ncbi:MAG: hypothetical protein NTW61_07190 [Candidatus Melainabacteria bacterium]|nr:hypothetical protein [Candidatus Melainabacteria bacterium]
MKKTYEVTEKGLLGGLILLLWYSCRLFTRCKRPNSVPRASLSHPTKPFSVTSYLLLAIIATLFFSGAVESWAGLPQGTQTLVRFRRAYLISNITYPGGVGYYPQQEDDEADRAAVAQANAKLSPLSSVKQPKRLPVTAVKEAQEIAHQQQVEVAEEAEAQQSRRFNNGLFNILNVLEFGDASIAKRMARSPKPLRFLDHYDNGEDYLYLPAIGIPLPIRLQSKNTFIH